MTIRDHLGLTALDGAEKAEHEECMIVLRAAADKIEAQRIETLTILQEACSQVRKKIRQILNFHHFDFTNYFAKKLQYHNFKGFCYKV